jgi:hypothetical protein
METGNQLCHRKHPVMRLRSKINLIVLTAVSLSSILIVFNSTKYLRTVSYQVAAGAYRAKLDSELRSFDQYIKTYFGKVFLAGDVVVDRNLVPIEGRNIMVDAIKQELGTESAVFELRDGSLVHSIGTIGTSGEVPPTLKGLDEAFADGIERSTLASILYAVFAAVLVVLAGSVFVKRTLSRLDRVRASLAGRIEEFLLAFGKIQTELDELSRTVAQRAGESVRARDTALLVDEKALAMSRGSIIL